VPLGEEVHRRAETVRVLDHEEDRRLHRVPRGTGLPVRAAAEGLIEERAPVRLCKGAYKEPPAVAFVDKAEVDRSYAELMERLLCDGFHVALATHDERLIKRAVAIVRRDGIPRDRFEFQMLYGVRRDLQERLVGAGYTVRVYVPYGSQWYPYFMRRLAERPANLAFILRSLVREVSWPGR
jgi:proline dehydrogenase